MSERTKAHLQASLEQAQAQGQMYANENRRLAEALAEAVARESWSTAALRGLVEAAGWLLDAADCRCHVTREPPCYVCVARERVRAAESAMGGER